MTANPGKKRKREQKRSRLEEVGQQLAEALQQVAAMRQMMAEVVEDNMALLEAAKRNTEGQMAVRATVVREVDRLREDVSGELRFQIMRNVCKEIIPVLHAIRRMAATADFTAADVTRQHVESIALTLDGTLGRIGIDRHEVKEGVDVFNPHLHECVKVCGAGESPLPDAPPRTIVRVEEPGYSVHGKLAFPARVWVQKAGEETACQEKGAAQ